MKTIRLSTLILVGLSLTTGLFAQTDPHAHDHAAPKAGAPKTQDHSGHGMMGGGGMMGDGGMMGGKGMMAHCHEMMQKHEQMKAGMKAMDDKLAGLAATMNSATGNEKTVAMATVINEMVAQRKKSADMMTGMQSGMMQHMMEHMQMGKQSMMMCPMMQGMHSPKGSANKPADHSKHH